MKIKKALILTWTEFQDHEVVYPYYRLRADGFQVDIVADTKDSKGRVYGFFGLNMPCSFTILDFNSDIKAFQNNYDLLVLPGGVKSLEKLRQEKKVIEFISNWNSQRKTIASTCHGAQLLISAKAVKGRKISGYYSLQDDIVNAGGIYSSEPVVIDENIVSSPHYDYLGEWFEAVLLKYYS